ncbi:MAG: GNAT family N-acetyltransferase [Candidatus Pristimantibacillus lignocellulolyticus]|uniref:GNAT family N-acetyltransferase n=1 Tax=Candidatus Pristimantibacillus lignocellulolyticus TaxID=2994561 RepID=A0A9J6ZC17_9BACL|nr:MAG: GNAT family N-acetyltransferase [Candidatus Pristimantibacillus lignocellulolyticus]
MTTIQIINSSVNNDIYATQADPDDVKVINELVIQTVSWFSSIGSTQWNNLPNEQDDQYLLTAIANGEMIIFRKEGETALAGMVILQQYASQWDRKLWGEAATSENNAVYLHRLIVNRGYAGQGLGFDILSWIDNGIQFSGRDKIRLDCIAHNEKLNNFYKQCGYTYIAENDGFIIYEKMLPNVNII